MTNQTQHFNKSQAAKSLIAASVTAHVRRPDGPFSKSLSMTTLPKMPALRRLPARYASIVMPLILSIFMSSVVSAISTLKSLGFTPAFLATWPAAWAISWAVAFPTLLAVLPLVRRIVALVVAPPPSN